MSNRVWTLNRSLAIIVYGIAGCFILAHLTPTLAVRTKMLGHGYFISGLTAHITKSQQHASNGAALYLVSPSPTQSSPAAADLAKHSILLPNRYEVTTFGLSFATMSTSLW